MGVTRVWSVKAAGWASIAANCGLVVTGGAVRLTGSGLGCPTWPHCEGGSFVPHGAMGIHSLIEFGNRMLTFVLVAVAIYTLVAAWRSAHRDLRVIAVVIAAGIPLQAVVGGLAVLTKLNPWVVSLHLLTSMAIIGVAVLFLWRVHHPAVSSSVDDPASGGTPVLRWFALSTFVSAWLVLIAGTIVTGAGPHAGSVEAPRNGLSTLETSQFHADLVFLFVGLTLGLLGLLYATGAPTPARRAVLVLLAVELSQAVVGYVQYFLGVPVVLVGVHMLGASVISATVTWALLAVRESSDSTTPTRQGRLTRAA